MRSGRRKTDFQKWWEKIKEELEGENNDAPENILTTKAPKIWPNATSIPIFFPSSSEPNYPTVTPNPADIPINKDPTVKISYDGQQLLIEGIGGGAGGMLVIALMIFGLYFFQRGRSQQRRPAPVVGGESSAVTNPCTNPSPSAMASGPRVKSVPEGGSDVGALSPPPALQRADKEGSHAVSREQNKDKGAVPPIHQLMTDPPNKEKTKACSSANAPNANVQNPDQDKEKDALPKDVDYTHFARAMQTIGSELKQKTDEEEKRKNKEFENLSLEILKENSPVVSGGGGPQIQSKYPLIDIGDVTMEDCDEKESGPTYANIDEIAGGEACDKKDETAFNSLDSGFPQGQNTMSSSLIPSAPSQSMIGSPQFNSTVAARPDITTQGGNTSSFHGFNTLPTLTLTKPESLKQLMKFYDGDDTLTNNTSGGSNGPAKIPAKTAIKRSSLRNKGKYTCLKESSLARK